MAELVCSVGYNLIKNGLKRLRAYRPWGTDLILKDTVHRSRQLSKNTHDGGKTMLLVVSQAAPSRRGSNNQSYMHLSLCNILIQFAA